MSEYDSLKLTVYFGERDRVGRRFLAEELLDLWERYALQTSVLLRGMEGFGIKHHLHTQRLLTLSEDLPVVAIAVDTRDRVQQTVAQVEAMVSNGLVTLERARMFTEQISRPTLPRSFLDTVKLTVYCGRQEKIGGRPAYLAIVDLFHSRGVAGASVLLGVDGTAHGMRQRARFFSPNAEVPVMIESIGDGPAMERLLPELGAILSRPLLTLERVQVCKRDGRLLARPAALPEKDQAGMRIWQKLSVHAGEQARHGDRPLYVELIHRLRRAGASGATAIRGIWGYHGDHQPHGDRLLSLRRRVPVVTIVVDTPERIRGWFEIVDELTDETGLVTSEMVPAFRAVSPGIARGGTDLASRPADG